MSRKCVSCGKMSDVWGMENIIYKATQYAVLHGETQAIFKDEQGEWQHSSYGLAVNAGSAIVDIISKHQPITP